MIYPTSSIQHLCLNYLSHSMPFLEKTPFLESNPSLRKMVAAAVFIFVRNKDQLEKDQLVSSEPLEKASTGSVGSPKPAKLTRRNSVDARRSQLMTGTGMRSQLLTGPPKSSNVELDFYLSLCQHLHAIIPKGAAAVTTPIDEGLLGDYYKWFLRALDILQAQSKLIRGTIVAAAQKSPGLKLFGTPKGATARLSLHTSMSLDKLISLKISSDVHVHEHAGWQPVEVSDAISCLYEAALSDHQDTTDPAPLHAASEYTFQYFHAVYSNSAAVSRTNLQKFAHGILAHHESRELCMRIHTFGVLAGLIALPYDKDRVACHPDAFVFTITVIDEFLRPDLKNSGLDEHLTPESMLNTVGSLLRTDHKKTIVPAVSSPEYTSFREIVRKLVKPIPASSFNTADNLNVLLHELEMGCVRYKGLQCIDLDFVVMKMLTYWCKSYGGFNWFKVEAIYMLSKSKSGSRGGKRKNKNNVTMKGGSGDDVKIMVIEKPVVTVTKMQMDKFLDSRGCQMLVDWVRAFKERIDHRKNMANIRLNTESMVEEKKEEVREEVDIFEDEEVSVFEDLLPKKCELPLIKYPTKGLSFAFVNLKDGDGQEVSFEEFRMSSDKKNGRMSLSLILRTKMNQTYTVRAAAFDTVYDVIGRCKLVITNPHKHYVLSFDGLGLQGHVRLIKYGILNNACLRLYEEEEWSELCFVHQQLADQRRGGGRGGGGGGAWNGERGDGPPLEIQTQSHETMWES